MACVNAAYDTSVYMCKRTSGDSKLYLNIFPQAQIVDGQFVVDLKDSTNTLLTNSTPIPACFKEYLVGAFTFLFLLLMALRILISVGT